MDKQFPLPKKIDVTKYPMYIRRKTTFHNILGAKSKLRTGIDSGEGSVNKENFMLQKAAAFVENQMESPFKKAPANGKL